MRVPSGSGGPMRPGVFGGHGRQQRGGGVVGEPEVAAEAPRCTVGGAVPRCRRGRPSRTPRRAVRRRCGRRAGRRRRRTVRRTGRVRRRVAGGRRRPGRPRRRGRRRRSARSGWCPCRGCSRPARRRCQGQSPRSSRVKKPHTTTPATASPSQGQRDRRQQTDPTDGQRGPPRCLPHVRHGGGGLFLFGRHGEVVPGVGSESAASEPGW